MEVQKEADSQGRGSDVFWRVLHAALCILYFCVSVSGIMISYYYLFCKSLNFYTPGEPQDEI